MSILINLYGAAMRTILLSVLLVCFLSFTGTVLFAQRYSDSKSVGLIYLVQNRNLTPGQEEDFQNLSPDEKKQILQNYIDFYKLPLKKQKKLKKQYKKWLEMSPEEREILRDTFKAIEKKRLRKGHR